MLKALNYLTVMSVVLGVATLANKKVLFVTPVDHIH